MLELFKTAKAPAKVTFLLPTKFFFLFFFFVSSNANLCFYVCVAGFSM